MQTVRKFHGIHLCVEVLLPGRERDHKALSEAARRTADDDEEMPETVVDEEGTSSDSLVKGKNHSDSAVSSILVQTTGSRLAPSCNLCETTLVW